MTDHREYTFFDRAGLDYLAYAICNRLTSRPDPLVWQHDSPSYCKQILQAFGIEMSEPMITDTGNYEFYVTWGSKISEKWKDPYYLSGMLSILYDTYDIMVRAASVGEYNADIWCLIRTASATEDQVKDIVDILRHLDFNVNLKGVQDTVFGYPIQFMNVKW